VFGLIGQRRPNNLKLLQCANIANENIVFRPDFALGIMSTISKSHKKQSRQIKNLTALLYRMR
jgi:hypothetical protein